MARALSQPETLAFGCRLNSAEADTMASLAAAGGL
jgi:hypothetical protein